MLTLFLTLVYNVGYDINITEQKSLKRLLSYERTSNEGLRKAFFELRGSLEGDINNARREQFQMEQEVGNLRNEKKMVDKENAKLKREAHSYKERLEATLLKLEDADIRLRANVSADTDISKLRVRRLNLSLL